MVTWLERMNRVIGHIEENLDGHIDMHTLSKIACCPLVSLQRTFSFVAEIPLSEYIRRRRLTLSAFELQNSKIRVLDLALKYGYDSPEAFARAFHGLHGVSPSSARKKGVTLMAYPRISFLLTLKGAVPMEYRIEKKEAFEVYGIEGIFTTENGENLAAIPKFWEDIFADGRYEALENSTHIPQNAQGDLCPVNALCDYESLEDGKFPYMVFAFQTGRSDSAGYKTVTVPAATWAIFKSETHTLEKTGAVMQKLISRVYTDWLPTAHFDKIDGYELEMYYGSGDNCHCETWIRVASRT